MSLTGQTPGDQKLSPIDEIEMHHSGEPIRSGDLEIPVLDLVKLASFRPSRLKGRYALWLVTWVAGMGFTLFGYDQGVLSSLLTLPSFVEVFPETATGFGFAQSLLASSYQLGCFAGAILNMYTGDRLGRVKSLWVAGVGIVIGTILQAGSINYAMMIFARLFNGIFNGMLTSTVPAYQAECSKAATRGPYLMVSATVNIFGLMVSYWVGYAFYHLREFQISWRFPITFQCVFTFAMLGAMAVFRAPESPRWLAARGRHEECVATLACLTGRSVDDEEVVATWKGILETNAQSVGEFHVKEIFSSGPTQHLRRTLLGILAQCFQQLTGINLISYYLTSILEENIGLDGNMSRIIAAVNGTVYLFTASLAVVLIERVGRRNLMLWNAGAMGVTMAVLAGLFQLVQGGSRAAQIISVLCLFLFNTWFSIGWLGMTWLYPAEISPLRIRAPANGLSTASNWIFNFLVVMITGPMFQSITWGTYVFFAALNIALILPGVYWLFPETRGRSLEDVDVVFAGAYFLGVSPVKFANRRDLPAAGSHEAEKVLRGDVADL